jgi:hypothetical protein
MAIPATRAQFKQWCLNKIGDGVNQLNVSDDQVSDRIDEALAWFQEYHFEGTEKLYLSHLITTIDQGNRYIQLPDNVIGAVSIFNIGDALNTNNIFNIRYQIALNDLYTLTSVSMVPYYMAMQHLALLEELLVGKQPIRYNRNDNKFYIDMSWDLLAPGSMLIIECYGILDPDIYTKIWSNIWLQRYAVALIKQQYGTNLKKFGQVQMMGGVVFNGQQIYDEATADLEKIEQTVINSFSLPVSDMIA